MMQNSIPIKPIDDKVVLKPLRKQTKTTGGVILPDIALEKTLVAEVVAVGRGRINFDGTITAMQTKVGDKVVYPKMGGQVFEYKQEDYIIIREAELVAIIIEN
jgi:chaperonin GroES